MLGAKLPIRLLKSPHTIVINYGWAKLSRSSIYCVAVFCCIFRFNNDKYGGIYILNILIRVLFGSNIFVNMPYSFDCVDSIFSGLRT